MNVFVCLFVCLFVCFVCLFVLFVCVFVCLFVLDFLLPPVMEASAHWACYYSMDCRRNINVHHHHHHTVATPTSEAKLHISSQLNAKLKQCFNLHNFGILFIGAAVCILYIIEQIYDRVYLAVSAVYYYYTVYHTHSVL